MTKYSSITNKILHLGKEEVKDYWKENAEIPLFFKRPYDNYNGEINREDIITMKIDTRGAQQRNPMNGLVCAGTGVGKTRLVKNIVRGFHKQNFRVLFIEPKSTEMMNASKMGKGRRLAPGDFNETLPVSCYCPNYVKIYLEKNMPDMLHKVKFYSPDINKMDYVEIWESLGMPTKVAALIVEMIQKGHTDLNYFESHLPKLHSATMQAVSTAIAALKALNFFGAKQKGLPLEEEWEKGNIVVVNYFSKDGNLMNTNIGLDLDIVRDIGIIESRKGLNNVTKKLIIFDDISMYAGVSATLGSKSSGVNLAIKNISNCQNNFRTWGVDSLIITQSPASNFVIPSLIDGCQFKFVSYVENPNDLVGKIPYNAFNLVRNTDPRFPMLRVDAKSYTYQWIFCKNKTEWETGFPADCTVGHS